MRTPTVWVRLLIASRENFVRHQIRPETPLKLLPHVDIDASDVRYRVDANFNTVNGALYHLQYKHIHFQKSWILEFTHHVIRVFLGRTKCSPQTSVDEFFIPQLDGFGEVEKVGDDVLDSVAVSLVRSKGLHIEATLKRLIRPLPNQPSYLPFRPPTYNRKCHKH